VAVVADIASLARKLADTEPYQSMSGADALRALAWPVIVADLLAVQFHGSSVCNSFCFVRPETMRSSTSVR
jgi:hypothetical protein